MGNIVDYAKTKLDTLARRPFCDLDSAILCWLSYLHFPEECQSEEGVALKELFRAELFESMLERNASPEDSLRLFTACCASPRFRDMRVCSYVSQLDKESALQFSAVTFRFGESLTYIAFRGTDSTFTGWKEDCLLAVLCPVGAQHEAGQYLKTIAGRYEGPLMVGGHSKGGNLAMYASTIANMELLRRLEGIWSLDGPGFLDSGLLFNLTHIQNLVHKIVPEASVIGMLMESGTRFRIVESTHSGLQQHNPLYWVVDGCEFVEKSTLHAETHTLSRAVNDWVRKMERDERLCFINTLFEVLESTSKDSFSGFSAELKKNLPIMMREAMGLDEETKAMLTEIACKLLRSGVSSVTSGVTHTAKNLISEAAHMESSLLHIIKEEAKKAESAIAGAVKAELAQMESALEEVAEAEGEGLSYPLL